MIILYRCLLLAVAGLALETAIDNNNCTDVRINNGPLIIPCVSEVIIQKGQNYTLTCKGSTKLRFIQQEVSEEVTSNFKIVNTSKFIDEEGFSYQRTLDLYNVDQYAIGYYACSDDSVDENIVNSIVEEPKNDEHVSYIYVYVNGTGNLFAPMKELIMSRHNKILIECRPTTPDVEVNLWSPKSQNKTPKYSPKIGFILKKCDSNSLTCQGRRGNDTDKKRIRSVPEPPVPLLRVDNRRFVKGENFSLICTVNITLNDIVKLSWNLPAGLNMDDESIQKPTADSNVTHGEIYSILNIINATKNHAGTYTCESSNGHCAHKESNPVVKTYLDDVFVFLRIKNNEGITRQNFYHIALEIDGYPPVNNITILKDGIKLPTDTEKYNLTLIFGTNYVFKIDSLKLPDIGRYTFIASNGKVNKIEDFQLLVGADPINYFNESNKRCQLGQKVTLKCDVSGYPLPNITWKFTADNETYDIKVKEEKNSTAYNKTSYVDLDCAKSGSITCLATSSFKKRKSSKTRQVLIYEIAEGFGILSNNNDGSIWVLENDVVSIKCLASKYDFENVTWVIDNEKMRDVTVKYPAPTNFSYVSVLEIFNSTMSHAGKYKCIGKKADGSEVHDRIKINVLELKPPAIKDNEDSDEDVFRFMDINLNCTVTGAPLPQVKWIKDGKSLTNDTYSNVNIYENEIDRTTINATVQILKIQPDNVGKYECVAKGRHLTERKSFTLKFAAETESNKHVMIYIIAIAIIFLILIILVVYLTMKIKKEKQFRKELAAAGLLYFKEGVINSLNPDLGIDEQAELLPYDEKFEFPPEKLVYGKQLGAGAFGVVYKAEARGIINAEESTPVAVKMVKKTADNMYIKALASELKIMVHLGKHINIVNLLGACTKNVGKRELVVIVEYCKYGNIHNYMQRHREVFIDQLDTDNKEKMGKVNRAYTTTSSGSTGMHSSSDYFGSANTQNTDNTFLNTANTVHSTRKTSEGYVQPEWRSNYESDYSYDGRSPRPLTSRDLLAWAFQISRGMEYLASRKVLHGDLAARNILLADDNIVKICDFGLAKSIYKNDEYRTKENSLLPVKWLAIECMTDRILSTQSDVWAFGIVLWELFTLAKTPYPNIHPSNLLQFLSEGHRLDKPPYADDRLYGVMKRCWEAKPTMRPTFSQLQEILGTFLEDNVRNHYVDLNSTYMDKNAQVAGQEDYLDMVCAPDYNNMVTPSPHHYVNTDNQKSFFPPSPVKVDEEGYLQMSPTNQGIFSPRSKDPEFDFDTRMFNLKSSEAGSCGSELTPMLTLNNLPTRSGSESDHEGNAPLHNVCTRIDEEADEVFVPSLNDKNAKNVQSAVTNPTYITFDHIDEKPKDIMNSYVNINVPNGLVK